MNPLPISSKQPLNPAYRITTLLLCFTCLYAGPGNANDLKDILVEALKDKNMNHAEMKHDNNTHGNGKLGSNMDHSNMKSGGPGHKPVDASTWPSKPSLTLTAYKDAMAGWNLHIEPTNFDFAPERVNTANEVGKGHAHLYINGKKITRLYSNWYYLNSLQPGIHSVTVALNTNDHGPLVLEEQHISATVELIQE